MKVQPHIVRQGEYLTQLAAARGYAPAEIWQHERNAELRDRRSSYDVLAPGDIIYLPESDRDPAKVEPHVVNRYRAVVPRVHIALRLADPEGGLANQRYVLDGLGSDEERIQGRTDADGNIRFEVPIGVEEVRVVFIDRNVVIPIRIGHLDPMNERTGVRQRLMQLGYYGFGVSNQRLIHVPDERADAEAVRAFQATHALPVTGDVDPATRTAIGREHGDAQ